jgi:hypothetical protein
MLPRQGHVRSSAPADDRRDARDDRPPREGPSRGPEVHGGAEEMEPRRCLRSMNPSPRSRGAGSRVSRRTRCSALAWSTYSRRRSKPPSARRASQSGSTWRTSQRGPRQEAPHAQARPRRPVVRGAHRVCRRGAEGRARPVHRRARGDARDLRLARGCLAARYLLPNGALSIVEGTGAPLAEIVNGARLAVDPPSKGLLMPDLAGDKKTFVVEAFFNSYCNLISSRRAKAAASASACVSPADCPAHRRSVRPVPTTFSAGPGQQPRTGGRRPQLCRQELA